MVTSLDRDIGYIKLANLGEGDLVWLKEWLAEKGIELDSVFTLYWGKKCVGIIYLGRKGRAVLEVSYANPLLWGESDSDCL